MSPEICEQKKLLGCLSPSPFPPPAPCLQREGGPVRKGLPSAPRGRGQCGGDSYDCFLVAASWAGGGGRGGGGSLF